MGTLNTSRIGGEFNTPRGLGMNTTGNGGVPAGTFYVADAGNNRVQRFSPTGGFVSTWGFGVRNGDLSFQTCTVAANCLTGKSGTGAGQLTGPTGLAVDSTTGAVYVFETRRISVFSATGTFLGAFGWGVANGTAALQFCSSVCQGATNGNSVSAPGQLINPGGLTFVNGELYVSNLNGRRVDVFQPVLSGNIVTGITFKRMFGGDVTSSGPDNTGTAFEVCNPFLNPTDACKNGHSGTTPGQFGTATAAPIDVAVDSTGAIYAVDTPSGANLRIQKLIQSPASVSTATFGSAALSTAFGTGRRN